MRVADCAVAIVLGVLSSVFAVAQFYRFDFKVVTNVFDVWFGADTPRIVGENTAFNTPMVYRVSVHPLSGIRSLPFLALHALGLNAQQVNAAFVGFSAFALAVIFYATGRGLGLTRLAAMVATALMLSTSAAMFWTVVPENWALGAVTLLIPLAWLTARRGTNDVFMAPLQSILSVSLIVTNWVAGLLAPLLALGPRAMLWSGTVAFAGVAALSVIQRLIFVHAGPFFGLGGERRFISAHPRHLIDRISDLWSELFLAPNPVGHSQGLVEWTVAFGRHATSPLFWVASAGWLLLAVLALASLWRGVFATKPLTFLIVLLLFQVDLFAIYGDGYFLYSLQIVPFVVLLLAASLIGPFRNLALIVMLLTAAFTGWYNFGQLRAAIAIYDQYQGKVLGLEVTPPPRLSDLAPERVARELPIRIKLQAVPFSKVLQEQFRALTAASENADLSYAADQGAARSQRLAALSYAAVAMARAGYSDHARKVGEQIIRLLAQKTDATMADLGLALWALGETSSTTGDPAFDTAIKGAVYAAAEATIQAVETPSPRRIPLTVDPTPLAMLTKDMQLFPDWRDDPTLFAESFAWRGLIEAAGFADRIGDHAASQQWRQGAADARRDWRFEFRREALGNPLTRTTLFWPTGVAYRDRKIISQHLHFPIDYGVPATAGVAIAEAHQFLRLGEPDTMWHRLGSVLTPDLQPSAGLLPGNADAMWRAYRGLPSEHPANPSLRTSAELTLLILESLGFAETDDSGQVIVIGGGLRADWLNQPISVSGLRTSAGIIDWSWDGSSLLCVRAEDPSVPIKLGPAFPPNTRIERLQCGTATESKAGSTAGLPG
jgi:hypothetical protein